MSSDKNFPQHITKRSLEKLEYISIIHYSNFIKTPTIRVYFSSFAFKKILFKIVGNKRGISQPIDRVLKISLSRSFIPPLLRKNYSRLPFLFSRRTQYSFIFHILFLSCPFLFHSLSLYTMSIHTCTRRGRMLRVTKW